MRPTLRFLHLLGLALFLGSLPAHIILGALGPGGDLPPQGVLFARTVIRIITLAATVPGLLLLTVTGLARWRARGPRWDGGRWLVLHLGLGLTILAVGLLVLTPVIFNLAGQARAMVDGEFAPAAWHLSKTVEDVAGAFNLVAALVAVALVCYRPALRRRLDRQSSRL